MSAEVKATAFGTIIGTMVKVIFASSIGVIAFTALISGLCAYLGQIIGKWLVKWGKGQIKSIRIRFNEQKKP